MAIMDYDRIVQVIEENITKSKKDLVSMVTTMLHLQKRDINEILKFIDPKGRTLPEYVFERKLFRALEDFASGMSKDSIAEKYQYTDTSHFGDYVYNLCGGKTPLQHRKDGYNCPAPLYLKDILEDIINNTNSEIETAYKKELIGFVDEITRLKDELSREKQRKVSSVMSTMQAVEAMETRITEEKYSEFLEIEDVRVLYGFDVKTMLRLYNNSLTSGVELEDLCDQELERRYYNNSNITHRDEIDSLAYHVLYEGDSVQNWEYYCGDDEVDDRESVREENLYSDVEVLTDFDDICNESYEGDDFDEDNEPTDDELKEWTNTDNTFA